jgi:hypothetical protein
LAQRFAARGSGMEREPGNGRPGAAGRRIEGSAPEAPAPYLFAFTLKLYFAPELSRR